MSKRRNDTVLAVVLLLIAVAGLLLYKGLGKKGDFAVVLINGVEETRLPLSEDTEFVITTENGENILVISGGKAYMKKADCPDGICVDHAPVFRTGETIVCLPHGVVVFVKTEKTDTGGLDMVA